MKRLSIIIIAIASVLNLTAQMARSPKRGICENNPNYTQAYVDSIKAGVAWTYNWAVTPQPQPDNLRGGDGMTFAPMCWNNLFNETELRAYLTAHPETEYLLGYNEPNFADQANMTPAVAAEQWPLLESIAEEYNLKLVSPALNFSGSQVGGRVWGIDDWLGEFIKIYRQNNDDRDPRMDYIALHCYMNWSAALDWFVNDYLYESGRNAELKAYFSRNGRKQIMLTEWCAWEGDKDGFTTSIDSQIDQMVQKVQIMEKSDNVAGYAWFMGIGGNAYNSYPYWHVFEGSGSNRHLTELGAVYAHMSSFDTLCWWKDGQAIPAKDYIDMYECKLRRNSDPESNIPIEISYFTQYTDWQGTTITPFVDYQVEFGKTADYTFRLRLNSAKGAKLQFVIDGKVVKEATITPTDNWESVEIDVPVSKGRHTLRISNVSKELTKFNWLSFAQSEGAGVSGLKHNREVVSTKYYDLNGKEVSSTTDGPVLKSTVYDDGTQITEKLIKN